ncbi:tyrosine-type recombinase/integrase [Phreatobacter sp.]|uniref:tyrosine-type recombinase/integrase n=1 Tax=Phreatobacter sp. TaxID=1966341 RepID=UPI003F727E4F
MPRPSKGPRLYADPRRRQWIIRDGSHFRRTGCALDDREGADRALAAWLGEKLSLPERESRLAGITAGEVLIAYGRERAPHVRASATIGWCIKALSPFWAGRLLSEISGNSCRAYAEYRRAAGVSDGTIRRELTTLRAAIGHWHREHGPLDAIPAVSMPDRPAPRETWLTRTEAAELLLGALGWQAHACVIATRRPTLWRRSPEASLYRHVARFVLVALRTGSRHEAVLALSWLPQISGGWVDVDRSVMHRRGTDETETAKRRPPTRISRKLLPHLRRWRRLDEAAGIHHVISWRGDRIAKLRTGWDRARRFASLPDHVTPHVLRHTRCTWLMQEGVPIAEAAGSVGMSIATFERVYGHHHPDFQSRAAAV